MCSPCVTNRVTRARECHVQYQAVQAGYTEELKTCHYCVQYTGFPDIDPESCTKYKCPIYQKRNHLRMQGKQIKNKAMLYLEGQTDVDLSW